MALRRRRRKLKNPLKMFGGFIKGEYIEVESGKVEDRLDLIKALSEDIETTTLQHIADRLNRDRDLITKCVS
jgi:hypothetical protein